MPSYYCLTACHGPTLIITDHFLEKISTNLHSNTEDRDRSCNTFSL